MCEAIITPSKIIFKANETKMMHVYLQYLHNWTIYMYIANCKYHASLFSTTSHTLYYALSQSNLINKLKTSKLDLYQLCMEIIRN